MTAAAAPYEFILDLRWSDVGPQGHVSNVRIVEFAAEARMRFHVLHLEMPPEGIGWVVAHQAVDHHAEVVAGAELRMLVGILHLGRTSFRLRQQGVQHGRSAFTVETVLVHLDEKGRPRPVDPEVRCLYRDNLWPTGDIDGQSTRIHATAGS